MGRPKSQNPMNERILIRMTPALRLQLERYSKSNNKLVSTSARDAIKSFISEEKSLTK